MASLEDYLSGKLYARSSPQFRRFIDPQISGGPTIDISKLTPPKERELAGATEEEIERARQFEVTRGDAGIVSSRSLLEGTRTPEGEFQTASDTQPRGIIESIAKALQLGASGTIGGVSGLLGQERLRETAGDGTFFETPESLMQGEMPYTLAARRFWQGITGQEQFRSADFGILAYDREEASLPERAMKSTAGFIIDTALDPTTYVSLGGGVAGRVVGSQRVFAMFNNKFRSGVEAALLKAPVSKRMNIIAKGSQTQGMSPSMISKRIIDELEDFALQADPATKLRIQKQISKLNDNLEDVDFLTGILSTSPQLSTSLATDILAANGALAYRTGTSWGLKNYLRKELGDDGTTLFRSLPLDMQGGIRFRMPFSSFGSSEPKILFRVPGTERLAGVTDGARQWLRNNVPVARTLSQKAFGKLGPEDMQLASAAYNAQRNTTTKIFGAIDPETRGIFWWDLAERRALQQSDSVYNKLVNDSVANLLTSRENLKNATAAYARTGASEDDAYQAAVGAIDRAFEVKIIDETGRPRAEALREAFGKNPTEAEIEAFGAASSLATITNNLADHLEQLADGDSRLAFERLQSEGEYFPRIIDFANEFLSNSQGRRGASGKFLSRDNFVSVYDHDGKALQYMSPTQIANVLSENVDEKLFLTDPIDVTTAYLYGVSRLVSEERMFQHMTKTGMIVRGEPVLVPNVEAARRAAIAAKATLRTRSEAIEGIGSVSSADDAQTVLEALQGWKQYRRTILENYQNVELPEDSAFAAIYRSADGAEIVQTPQGSWLALNKPDRNKQAQFLTRSNKFTGQRTEAARFSTKQEAELALNANRNVINRRNKMYQTEANSLMVQFREDVAKAFLDYNELDVLGQNVSQTVKNAAGRWHPSPAHTANIPVGPQANEYIGQIVEWINKYTDNPTVRERYMSQAMVGERYRAGIGDGKLYRLLSSTDGGVTVRSDIQARFQQENMFVPANLVEPIRRMFRVYEQPEGFRKFIEDYYKPLYNVQKALMTAQRGPGYILRNIQGGVWTGYLNDVRGEHFAKSGRLTVIRIRALAEGKRRAAEMAEKTTGRSFVLPQEESAFAMQAFERMLKKEFGNKEGKFLFEAWETFANNGMDGVNQSSRTAGTMAQARVGEASVQLRRLQEQDFGWYENATDWLAARSRWARMSTRAAAESENYLRFAAYLRGVEDFGLEDGGLAAALHVKASQFDYADLSDFERDVLKMIMPFYTWARYNIPLQLRAIISEPGKIAKALRIHDSARQVLGEPEDKEDPLPVWVRAQMGWQIRRDLLSGPYGDSLSLGLIVGEPLVDVNRLFRFPSADSRTGINLTAVADMLNPAFKTGAEILSSMEASTGGIMPRREQTPGWAKALQQPFIREGDEITSSTKLLRLVRNNIPPVGTLERIFPETLGNDRTRRRWYTSMASTLFGLPAATLDPFQTAAELRAEEQRNRRIIARKFGDNWGAYTEFARGLLRVNATPYEISWLQRQMFDGREFQDVEVEELDLFKARDTIAFKRQLDAAARAGVSRPMLEDMVRAFRPRSDYIELARQGVLKRIPDEILEDMGYTRYQVDQMTTAQRQTMINNYYNIELRGQERRIAEFESYFNRPRQ